MPKLTLRDGARLHYFDVGKGPPVLMLHGFAMPAALWLPFIAPLARRYRFILPDLRGFGGSHELKLGHDCLLTQHAHDVSDLIERLDLRDLRLGGLSMGACTALQYHRLFGFERVRSYLHMDQSPCVRNGPDWADGLLGVRQLERLGVWRLLLDDMEAYRHLPLAQVPFRLRRRMWAAISEFFGYGFHHRFWRTITSLTRHEVLIRRIAPMSNWPIYMDCLRFYLTGDYDWRTSLPQLQVPMTVMVGMQSVMYPPAGQFHIRELVPHARFVRFENCGHAFPFEAPRRFVRELNRHLEAA